MAGDSDHIDFSNLQDQREELEKRVDRFSDFTSFVIGLLLGAIISVPVQLLFRPLSFKNGALTYGPRVLLDPAPGWIIPVISFILLVIILFIVIAGYFFALGLAGRESVDLKYECDDYDSFFIEVRDYLQKEAEFLDVEISAKNRRIECSDPNRIPTGSLALGPTIFGMNIISDFMIEYIFPKTIIKIQFDHNLSVMTLRYDPNSENANILINRLEEKFGDS